ncbi:MAG TPA: MFS transporter [Candidatus Limnocylindrales bacterium]|nr:MFS transporter [Candidatus Limnocylindrales bacterium]
MPRSQRLARIADRLRSSRGRWMGRGPRPPRLSPTGWLARWGPILPLLGAEFIAWVGFGALLPVMPLYFTQHGVDLATLGVIVAAWPAARLVGEPIFGWLADRTARVPIMVGGLIVTGLAMAIPLVFIGAGPFLVMRALAGFATAAYDPAARGYLTDATPTDRRGEAFGLYGAAQMGGLMLGPAIGGLGAAAFGGFEFVFVFGAVGTLVAGLAVALRVPEQPVGPARARHSPGHDLAEFPIEAPIVYEHAADDVERDIGEAVEPTDAGSAAPRSLWNRLLIAALVLNLGSYFAGATYEVIWSLYLESKGAGLDFIGFTFALFGLPVLLFSPIAGRWVDRRGSYGFLVIGGVAAAVASVSYPFIALPVQAVPILVVEATGFALLNPALYAVVAAGSPRGRSSTAQGLYGAAGTVGTIVASIAAGSLAAIDLRFPFWVGGAGMTVCLVACLVIGGAAIRGRLGRERQRAPLAVPG